MAPLLRPTDSCVLFVDPRNPNIVRLNAMRQEQLTQCLNLIADAALAGDVPAHIAFVGGPPESCEWAITRQPFATGRIHTLDTTGPSWSNPSLHTALTADGRTCLILCGFWLETTITFLALPALASGLDVFALMDATPAWLDAAAHSATDRLLQAGVVPLATHQLIAEWAQHSPASQLRSFVGRPTPFD
jgi:hypothetical protein